MHFWIDKRSQCYNSRHRVPSSLSAGKCAGGVYGGAPGGRKGMAAPVHRFMPVDCAPRRPRSHRRYGAPPLAGVHCRRPEEPSTYVEVPAEPPQPPQPTIASLAAARSVTPDTLLRTAALGLHDPPAVAPHLKFGILVSLALATVFMAGAKYYFDRQVVNEDGSHEAGVMCLAMACVCGMGCALSLCRPRSAAPPVEPVRVCSTATRERMLPSEPSEDISLTTLLQTPEQTASTSSPEAPPPYHIAVLLPPRESSPPPPAYSALS
ncbi:lysine-specific demethylase 6B [Leptidea sinapis]|uniref:lysine-specific demethylase 6B n=1 Tax=Leptidea sinapis TaxID=189913 RepID=UPI0021C281B8|nr:lysine-specific demethylase 6B [Leptidea sinapis]